MPAIRTGLPFESKTWLPLVCQNPAPTPDVEAASRAGARAAAPAVEASGSIIAPTASATELAAASAAASCLRVPPIMDALLPDVVLHEAVQEERPGRAAMGAKAP